MSSTPPRRLVLASSSPRRRELLTALGLAFSTRPVDVDESPLDGEGPEDYVVRLARAKALAAEPSDRELVVAADTIVVLDRDLLGKPADEEAASRMLAALAGRQHEVLTGVAVAAPPAAVAAAADRTRVRMAAMGDEDVSWYVATREPLDKAGAYAIQGLGALFIESLDGNYTNVVGLPLPTLFRLARSQGFDLRGFSEKPPVFNLRT